MNEIQMIEAVERYIRGEMKTDERVHFEHLRKTNAELDQLVVEHTLFLHEMNELAESRSFKSLLNNTHVDLAERGQINSSRLKGRARVVYLFNRYKRVAAIAATIAGITTLTFSFLVWSISPKAPAAEIEKLKGEISHIKTKTNQNDREIKDVKSKIENEPAAPGIIYTTGGTGFMIDPAGYLVTNAHVIDNARHIAVQNAAGKDYLASVVYTDTEKDIAILKIEDESFKSLSTIPYSISRQAADLAEPIFTLGYPRNEIVYGQGYLSSKTGFRGDTLSCQIEIAANRGNSGSPILNRSGEVIGILNGRQTNAQGFAFAIQAKYIYQVVQKAKKDSSLSRLKLPLNPQIKGMERVQQVKKIEDYVFMVKVN